jgi:hypothetical protein
MVDLRNVRHFSFFSKILDLQLLVLCWIYGRGMPLLHSSALSATYRLRVMSSAFLSLPTGLLQVVMIPSTFESGREYTKFLLSTYVL